MPDPAEPTDPRIPATRSGPGRILIAGYATFAVAATGRAILQLATRFEQAPLAYSLSAVAAAVYLLATLALVRGDRFWWRVAVATCTFELLGVLTVGAASIAVSDAFPDETVWSQFGRGYGYFPLLLPVLGLAWLRRTRY